MKEMRKQMDVHISTEESRILRMAELLIAEEMQGVRQELERLRDNLARTSETQRRELQKFYDETRAILRGTHDFGYERPRLVEREP